MMEWEYDPEEPKALVLYKDGREVYDITLNNCKTRKEVLNWIAQINGKSWATNEVVGDFVRRLDKLIGLRTLKDN